MIFVDTHTHLYDPAFDGDLAEAVLRARRAGVQAFVMPDVDAGERARMLSAAERIGPSAHICVGLHPESVLEGWEEELQAVFDAAEKLPAVAIGEIGLDFYWPTDHYEQQCEVFLRQLVLAARKDLPVIIHSRDATGKIFDVMDLALAEIKGSGKLMRGVFHAFTGSWETFCRTQRYGDFLVGIGGVSTYRNAGIAKTLERIPLDRILLETDSPYLPPVPHRGQRNESAFIPVIAQNIASIKGTTVDEVARVTTENACKLFGIKILQDTEQ